MYETQSVIHPIDSEKCLCEMRDLGKRLRSREREREREYGRERDAGEDW
jgi:hypothetical protein